MAASRTLLGIQVRKTVERPEGYVVPLGPVEEVIGAWDKYLEIVAKDEGFKVGAIKNEQLQMKFIAERLGSVLPKPERMNDEYLEEIALQTAILEHFDNLRALVRERAAHTHSSQVAGTSQSGKSNAGTAEGGHAGADHSTGTGDSSGAKTASGSASGPDSGRGRAGSGSRKATSKGRSKGRSSARRRRTKLVQSSDDILVSNSRGKRALEEMERLPVKSYPNAASLMLRFFLELSVTVAQAKSRSCKAYVTKKRNGTKKPEKDPSLQAQAKWVAEWLCEAGRIDDQVKKALILAVNRKDLRPGSVRWMHENVHNPWTNPQADELFAAWDSIQPMLEGLWNELDAEAGEAAGDDESWSGR
jgi:hypothetical protein